MTKILISTFESMHARWNGNAKSAIKFPEFCIRSFKVCITVLLEHSKNYLFALRDDNGKIKLYQSHAFPPSHNLDDSNLSYSLKYTLCLSVFCRVGFGSKHEHELRSSSLLWSAFSSDSHWNLNIKTILILLSSIYTLNRMTKSSTILYMLMK
jgi:hypothetical protein